MIQPNEIRLNNWVQTQKGTYKQIKDICEDGSVWLRCNLCVKAKYRHELEGLHPIPLTEDVLLKCGAKLKQADNNWKYYDIGGFLFDFNIKKQMFWFSAFDRDRMQMSNDFDIEVKYLHQLQNLYFALTNQELEIEL